MHACMYRLWLCGQPLSMGPYHTVILPSVRIGLWLFYDLPYPQPPPQPNCAGASLAEGGSPSVEGALGPENGR